MSIIERFHYILTFPSARAEITLLRESRDLLIVLASSRVSPMAFGLFHLPREEGGGRREGREGRREEGKEEGEGWWGRRGRGRRARKDRGQGTNRGVGEGRKKWSSVTGVAGDVQVHMCLYMSADYAACYQTTNGSGEREREKGRPLMAAVRERGSKGDH